MADTDIIPADMRAALDGFDRLAEEIIASFVGPLDFATAAAIDFPLHQRCRPQGDSRYRQALVHRYLRSQ